MPAKAWALVTNAWHLFWLVFVFFFLKQPLQNIQLYLQQIPLCLFCHKFAQFEFGKLRQTFLSSHAFVHLFPRWCASTVRTRKRKNAAATHNNKRDRVCQQMCFVFPLKSYNSGLCNPPIWWGNKKRMRLDFGVFFCIYTGHNWLPIKRYFWCIHSVVLGVWNQFICRESEYFSPSQCATFDPNASLIRLIPKVSHASEWRLHRDKFAADVCAINRHLVRERERINQEPLELIRFNHTTSLLEITNGQSVYRTIYLHLSALDCAS